LSAYSIVEFLQSLSDDELEEKMIALIAEGYRDEALLLKLLELTSEG